MPHVPQNHLSLEAFTPHYQASHEACSQNDLMIAPLAEFSVLQVALLTLLASLG